MIRSALAKAWISAKQRLRRAGARQKKRPLSFSFLPGKSWQVERNTIDYRSNGRIEKPFPPMCVVTLFLSQAVPTVKKREGGSWEPRSMKTTEDSFPLLTKVALQTLLSSQVPGPSGCGSKQFKKTWNLHAELQGEGQ